MVWRNWLVLSASNPATILAGFTSKLSYVINSTNAIILDKKLILASLSDIDLESSSPSSYKPYAKPVDYIVDVKIS